MRKIILSMLAAVALPLFASPDYYLTGEFNGWKPNQSQYKFTENGDIYTLTVASLAGEFKITTANWEHQFGAGAALRPGETYKCRESSNGYNMTIADPSAEDITLTFDDRNKTIGISVRPVLYLVGEFNGWAVSPPYRFYESDGLYILRTRDFKGEFKIVSSDNTISFGGGDPSGLLPNREYSLLDGGASLMFEGIGYASERIKITVNPSGQAEDTGVTEITVGKDTDDAIPEYFTLQGIKVATPDKGVYIRRTGTKTEKILIK